MPIPPLVTYLSYLPTLLACVQLYLKILIYLQLVVYLPALHPVLAYVCVFSTQRAHSLYIVQCCRDLHGIFTCLSCAACMIASMPCA